MTDTELEKIVGLCDLIRDLKKENIKLKEMSSPSQIPCHDCKGPVIEFSIANELWNMLIRENGPETDSEYLCINCFALRVVDLLNHKNCEVESLNKRLFLKDFKIAQLEAQLKRYRQNMIKMDQKIKYDLPLGD